MKRQKEARETEKSRRERFERQLYGIPKDKATVLQRKTEIASKLHTTPDQVTFTFLAKLIRYIRELRVDCYQLSRDPRTLWYYVHQVWKNLEILEQHASVLMKKLELPGIDDLPLSESLETDNQDNKTPECTPAVEPQSNSVDSPSANRGPEDPCNNLYSLYTDIPFEEKAFGELFGEISYF